MMGQRAERKKIQKANNKTQGKKELFAARKSVLNNADNLCKNGEKIINSFRSEKIKPKIQKLTYLNIQIQSQNHPLKKVYQKEEK